MVTAVGIHVEHSPTGRWLGLADRPFQRLARCVVGLGLFGLGIAMILVAELGLAPWDVFHQGLAELTGISVGWALEITAFAVLLAWIPLRQRPGVGTILNAVEIGLVVALLEDVLPSTDRLVPRLAWLAGGIVVIAVGSGLYIGAGLGAGPRDGLMVGIAARGISIRLARTLIETTALLVGVILGGGIGLGTVAFTLGIGPLIQLLLPLLALRPRSKKGQP